MLNRRIVLALLTSSMLVRPASAVSVMDPFNVDQAMDGGVVKIGNGIAYADGPRKKLDIYAPENPSGTAPVLFFIYGGAWRSGDRGEYQFVGRAFAARGFVTVVADYRLVPEVRYPEFLEDNAQALRWVQDNISRFGGDPNRMFIAGHSAGAYGAAMLVLDRWLMREYGVTLPIRAVAGLSGPYDFYPFEYGEVSEAFGSAPNPEGTQPVNLVTSEVPPMFLASGTSDPIVRVQNTESFAVKLKAQGVWVTERYYDGFGHMEPVLALGAMWRWRMPVLNDVVEFFARFGAFPGGAPRAVDAAPDLEAANRVDDSVPMGDIAKQLDALFPPISR